MQRTVEADSTVQPALFIPADQPYEHLIEPCRANGVALIAQVSDTHEVILVPEPVPDTHTPSIVRIQNWVLERVSALSNIDTEFANVLKNFVRRYRHLLEAGGATEEKQEDLIKKCIANLLSVDARYLADYKPLQFLRFFEQFRPREKSRDHYFHTFNNFLLGCIVIDATYATFQSYADNCCRVTSWSIEYAWLLTVLFHDVGYPIQKSHETSELIYGVQALGTDAALAEKRQAWESPPYKAARCQLVSLYDHLTQPVIESAWSADPFSVEPHLLDRALERSFFEKGHGAASSLRMLADFFRKAPTTHSGQRRFLIQHIFLAALSIPFHDWPVRAFLRELGITSIRTDRFPFGSLLMFIDSIQEDRRDQIEEPDILTGLTVNGNIITAEMELSVLSPEKLRDKQREANDVLAFLAMNGLTFVYPPGLLPQ